MIRENDGINPYHDMDELVIERMKKRGWKWNGYLQPHGAFQMIGRSYQKKIIFGARLFPLENGEWNFTEYLGGTSQAHIPTFFTPEEAANYARVWFASLVYGMDLNELYFNGEL